MNVTLDPVNELNLFCKVYFWRLLGSFRALEQTSCLYVKEEAQLVLCLNYEVQKAELRWQMCGCGRFMEQLLHAAFSLLNIKTQHARRCRSYKHAGVCGTSSSSICFLKRQETRLVCGEELPVCWRRNRYLVQGQWGYTSSLSPTFNLRPSDSFWLAD